MVLLHRYPWRAPPCRRVPRGHRAVVNNAKVEPSTFEELHRGFLGREGHASTCHRLWKARRTAYTRRIVATARRPGRNIGENDDYACISCVSEHDTMGP